MTIETAKVWSELTDREALAALLYEIRSVETENRDAKKVPYVWLNPRVVEAAEAHFGGLLGMIQQELELRKVIWSGRR